jgi:hypothetical protein
MPLPLPVLYIAVVMVYWYILYILPFAADSYVLMLYVFCYIMMLLEDGYK